MTDIINDEKVGKPDVKNTVLLVVGIFIVIALAVLALGVKDFHAPYDVFVTSVSGGAGGNVLLCDAAGVRNAITLKTRTRDFTGIEELSFNPARHVRVCSASMQTKHGVKAVRYIIEKRPDGRQVIMGR